MAAKSERKEHAQRMLSELRERLYEAERSRAKDRNERIARYLERMAAHYRTLGYKQQAEILEKRAKDHSRG